jgi:hypothetical protein
MLYNEYGFSSRVSAGRTLNDDLSASGLGMKSGLTDGNTNSLCGEYSAVRVIDYQLVSAGTCMCMKNESEVA